jgi:hypothetical protein
MADPRNHLAGVQPERQRRTEGKCRILAPIVVERGVSDFDGAIADRVQHLQAGDDFAGCKDLNLEFVVGDFGEALREIFATAVERVERFRPACGQAPFYFRRRLRNCRCSNGGSGEPGARRLQELTTFHGVSPR